MKIAIVGYNLFGVGGTSRSNINLIMELLDVKGVEITYYNIRKIPFRAVSKFVKSYPKIGTKIEYRHFVKLFEDDPKDVYILTRENLFILSKVIKELFPNSLTIGEVHAPLPQIQPEIDLSKESIDVYRVATERSKRNFSNRIGDYSGEIIPFPVSTRHLVYDKELSYHSPKIKNLYIYSRFDELQKDISYAIKLMDYLVNYKGDSEFKLYIQGTGPSEKLYNNLIDSYKLRENIFINQGIPSDAIYLSTARNETFGYSISEAFTSGRRVLLYEGDDHVLKDIYGNYLTFGWLTKHIESDAELIQIFVKKKFTTKDFQHDIAEAEKYSIINSYGEVFIDTLIHDKKVLKYQGNVQKQKVIDMVYAQDTSAKMSLLSMIYNFSINSFPGIKKLFMQDKIHTTLRRIYGSLYKVPKVDLPIQNNFAFIESFHGKSFAGDPKYLALELRKKNPEMQIFVSSVSDLVDDEVLAYNFHPVRLGSQDYIHKFRQCRFVITNGNTLDKCGKRNGQVFLQTWHGLPLKKMVADLENEEQRKIEASAFLPRMKRWDFLTTSSEFNTKLLKSAFMLNQNEKLQILEYGAPRNGYLIQNKGNIKEKERIHNKYFNRPYEGKKYLLYCPTWRRGSRKQITTLNLVEIIKNLPTEYEIIVKLHPLEGDLRGYYANLDSRIHCFFNEIVDIQELFLLSEVLITDYSSAMFDYAHLNRRIIILQEDVNEYNKQIGQYFTIEDLLGLKGEKYSELELCEKILEENEDTSYNNLIIKELMEQDSPNSARRIIDKIFEEIRDEKDYI